MESLRTAISETAQVIAEAMEWKPIETAPKDGTYVLLANQFGAWVGHYQRVAMSGFVFENPWRTMMLNHLHIKGAKHYRPSHWLPLPPPPAKEGI